MDLADFDSFTLANEGAVMEIMNPVTGTPLLDDSGKQMFIKAYGANSDVYRKHMNEAMNRRLGVKGKTKLTIEELEAEQLEVRIKVVTGWHITLGGKPLECTPQNVRKIFSDKKFLWLYEQFVTWHDNEANFMKTSSKTSKSGASGDSD